MNAIGLCNFDFRRSLAALLLLLSPVVAAPASTEPASAKHETFSSAEHGVSFSVPRQMERQKLSNKGIIVQFMTPKKEADSPLEVVQLIVVQTGRELKAEDLKEVVEAQRKTLEKRNATITTSQASKLGGINAHDLTASVTVNDKPREMKLILAVHNGKAYALSFTSEQGKMEELVQRLKIVTESFQWQDQDAKTTTTRP
ncbi:MAG TPA: PsbP-related protein [Tepidisphaeraceae bacterium]|jgi:hypothetical protein